MPNLQWYSYKVAWSWMILREALQQPSENRWMMWMVLGCSLRPWVLMIGGSKFVVGSAVSGMFDLNITRCWRVFTLNLSLKMSMMTTAASKHDFDYASVSATSFPYQNVRLLDPQVLVIIIVSHVLFSGYTSLSSYTISDHSAVCFSWVLFFWMVNIPVLRFKLVQILISSGWKACLMVESPVWCRIWIHPNMVLRPAKISPKKSFLEHNLSSIRKSTTLPIVMLVAHNYHVLGSFVQTVPRPTHHVTLPGSPRLLPDALPAKPFTATWRKFPRPLAPTKKERQIWLPLEATNKLFHGQLDGQNIAKLRMN